MLEAFESLKKAGKVRFFGLSTDDLGFIKVFNQEGQLHGLQVRYNLFDRQIEDEILPYCHENKIGVIVRGALCKGLLTGKFNKQTRFPADDLRNNWPNEEWYWKRLAAVERIVPLTKNGKTLAQVALQFVLFNPVVSVVIPGARNAKQLEENSLLDIPPLSEEDMAFLRLVSIQE